MLLATKLHIPVRQHDLVARPRLLDKLNAGLRSRLILLSTPAGFGKTTLLVQWLDSLRAQPGDSVAVAWLALDEGDNDPARFFAYLSAAIQRLCPDGVIAAQPTSFAAPVHEQFMTELINTVAAGDGHRLLILDDYHVLHTPALHQAVAFLIEHMPPTLHLVISSRADAPLPLARWRARRELTELREADLRFREDEAREFLIAIMGIEVTAQEAATLQQRTEGWIAGLQLAALSMQGADDLAHQVQRFAGTHIYIGDYLAEEVLQRQPPEIQQFLFDTSILPRLCGDLCNAVAGRTDSAAVLAALHRAHLFLTPLDEGHVWYRYHHLFAEMLRGRLKHGDPDHVRELHRQAARWHLDNLGSNGIGDSGIGEAIHHALAADPVLAADLLERYCGLFQQRGEYVTLDGWLQQLPETIYHVRPQLCLLRAKTHLFLHEVAEAEAWLARTRRTLREAPDLDPDAATLTAALIVQCDIALNQNELDAAINLAQQALALLQPEQLRARGEVLMLLGVAHYWRSDFALAYEAWTEAGDAAWAGDHVLMAVFARGNAARALYQQGRLRAAAAALDAIQQDAARRGDAHLPLYAGCYIAQAKVYCEWNQLEVAHQHLMSGLALARQGRNPRTLLQGHAHLLRILWAQGRVAEAAEAVAEAEAMIRQAPLPQRIIETYTYAAIRLALARDDEAAVEAWLATAPDPARPPVPGEEPLHLLLARVWAARGAYTQALDLLSRLQPVVEARAMGRLALETQLCRVAILAATGDQEAAAPLLTAALAQAAPEGFVRLFIEEGEPLRRLVVWLLPQLADPGLHAYGRRLLQAFSSQPARQPDAQDASAASPTPVAPMEGPAVEPLSARELEVLRLVARGLSDRAVAEQLVVVPGTVKRHLSNIYDKLGVHSRTQALARARALGWLKPDE